ncbi:MAG: hypothetical protein PV344_07450, partial [Anaplasma sp.]|nr:hypothetical protein [Anaplasma sp.]
VIYYSYFNHLVIFNAKALTSSCRRKTGVGGVTRKSVIGRRVMMSQPHDLALVFQTMHNAHVKQCHAWHEND